MSKCLFNLLTESLIKTLPLGRLSLPAVLAALVRDEVDSFPSLRPHQLMFWHMFLVQLAALALHYSGKKEVPAEEETWRQLLRNLTKEFTADEPWCLVVEDWSKPAFMQAPVPKGMGLNNLVKTADELDILITSKNHDLKQSIASKGDVDDWIFSLISLQTGEGYGGRSNYGIARMNGGSSSRPMLTIAPLKQKNSKEQMPRLGAWFLRDVNILIEKRDYLEEEYKDLQYGKNNNISLVWTVPWLEGEQLKTSDLDIWFIEICRRVRLFERDGRLFAFKGGSEKERIQAKNLKGNLGDPWAPIKVGEGKSFTLGEDGEFKYKKLIELIFSDEWDLPLLCKLASSDAYKNYTIIAMALARGNVKTNGFKSRILPIVGKVAFALKDKRKEIHELAKQQAEIVSDFEKILRMALREASSKREGETKTGHPSIGEAVKRLDAYADSIFFDYLWRLFDAQNEGEENFARERSRFAYVIWEKSKQIFEQYLPIVVGSSLFGPRGEVKGRSFFYGVIYKKYPELFEKGETRKHAE